MATSAKERKKVTKLEIEESIEVLEAHSGTFWNEMSVNIGTLHLSRKL